MWIIESDGDVFNGKKLWLRPGKTFMFGRTKVDSGTAAPGQFVISGEGDKSVSRQHLMVKIDSVEPTDCPNTRSRSKVTLTDTGTKIGTLLNGEQIRGTSVVLSRDENMITLGKFKSKLIFTWVPVTLTFSFTSKEQKSDPYTKLYQSLGPLDIKIRPDFERGITTHVVVKKRNTSKTLQALIDGKYIVHNDSFIKAVISAATPDDDGISALEKDFDLFPDPVQYLPPSTNEPTQRADDAYVPNSARHEMFEGYTFIFYDESQYTTLFPPISEGGGKALFRSVTPNETTVEDFVRYVKSVAGEKGLGEFEDGSEGKGVVVVRVNTAKNAGAGWITEFSTEVAQYLDHRLIEQNEFLDAILGNDASVLRRPLEPESSGVFAPPPTAATVVTQTAQRSQPAPDPTPAEPESQPAAPRRYRRGGPMPRFKGFDDDDDPPVIIASIPESMAVDPIPAESQSQSLFVSQDPDFNVNREPSQPPETQTRSSRKRKATPVDEEDKTDAMDSLAPATARLKKRRIEEEAARRRKGETTPAPPEPTKMKKQVTPPKLVQKTKKEKEAELLEQARIRKENTEKRAKEENESLNRVDVDVHDLQQMQSLAIIEEVELRTDAPPPRARGRADESQRWEDKWNGRTNFKKFRRRGAPAINARDLRKTIVPLEEAKNKAAGVGSDYWAEELRVGKSKKSKSQSQSQRTGRVAEFVSQDLNGDEEELPDISDIRPETPAVKLSSGTEAEEEEAPPVKRGGRATQSQKLKDKTAEKGNVRPAKRAAEKELVKGGAAKKARQAVVARKEESESDSDDELKFRFRKRG